MIKIYFETPNGSYAELVAVVNSEETCAVIMPALEELAKKNRMIVTESLLDEVDMEVIP